MTINDMNVDGILNYSLELKRGEKVFVFADLNSFEYCNLLARKIIEKGAVPYILWNDFNLNKSLIATNDVDIYEAMYKTYERLINECDAAIMLDNNIEEYQDVNYDDVLFFKNKYYLKIFQKIMTFERWVYLRYPQNELANLFNISYDDLVKLLEKVTNFNYEQLVKPCETLKEVLDNTEKIRVVNDDGTDVTFTKKGIPSAVCCGKWNLPDGEVYTAPEKYSMNGIIHFNMDTFFRNNTFRDIWVTVKDGRIIDSRCNLDLEFTKILDSDEGSRYFGEFAFGLNPFITRNYNDNLFNEKMVRTIHFAVGIPHYNTDNGNKSILHWDLIVNMEKGGRIYFDDALVQKDGIFVDERLTLLNHDKAKTKNLHK